MKKDISIDNKYSGPFFYYTIILFPRDKEEEEYDKGSYQTWRNGGDDNDSQRNNLVPGEKGQGQTILQNYSGSCKNKWHLF